MEGELGGHINRERYCTWGPYVMLLLREGLGLRAGEGQVRVGSGEVGWPLGAALVEGGKLADMMLVGKSVQRSKKKHGLGRRGRQHRTRKGQLTQQTLGSGTSDSSLQAAPPPIGAGATGDGSLETSSSSSTSNTGKPSVAWRSWWVSPWHHRTQDHWLLGFWEVGLVFVGVVVWLSTVMCCWPHLPGSSNSSSSSWGRLSGGGAAGGYGGVKGGGSGGGAGYHVVASGGGLVPVAGRRTPSRSNLRYMAK